MPEETTTTTSSTTTTTIWLATIQTPITTTTSTTTTSTSSLTTTSYVVSNNYVKLGESTFDILSSSTITTTPFINKTLTSESLRYLNSLVYPNRCFYKAAIWLENKEVPLNYTGSLKLYYSFDFKNYESIKATSITIDQLSYPFPETKQNFYINGRVDINNLNNFFIRNPIKEKNFLGIIEDKLTCDLIYEQDTSEAYSGLITINPASSLGNSIIETNNFITLENFQIVLSYKTNQLTNFVIYKILQLSPTGEFSFFIDNTNEFLPNSTSFEWKVYIRFINKTNNKYQYIDVWNKNLENRNIYKNLYIQILEKIPSSITTGTVFEKRSLQYVKRIFSDKKETDLQFNGANVNRPYIELFDCKNKNNFPEAIANTYIPNGLIRSFHNQNKFSSTANYLSYVYDTALFLLLKTYIAKEDADIVFNNLYKFQNRFGDSDFDPLNYQELTRGSFITFITHDSEIPILDQNIFYEAYTQAITIYSLLHYYNRFKCDFTKEENQKVLASINTAIEFLLKFKNTQTNLFHDYLIANNTFYTLLESHQSLLTNTVVWYAFDLAYKVLNDTNYLEISESIKNTMLYSMWLFSDNRFADVYQTTYTENNKYIANKPILGLLMSCFLLNEWNEDSRLFYQLQELEKYRINQNNVLKGFKKDLLENYRDSNHESSNLGEEYFSETYSPSLPFTDANHLYLNLLARNNRTKNESLSNNYFSELEYCGAYRCGVGAYRYSDNTSQDYISAKNEIKNQINFEKPENLQIPTKYFNIFEIEKDFSSFFAATPTLYKTLYEFFPEVLFNNKNFKTNNCLGYTTTSPVISTTMYVSTTRQITSSTSSTTSITTSTTLPSLLNLNANNTLSYPTTGGVFWYDLSGRNNTFSLINNPQIETGNEIKYIKFNETSDDQYAILSKPLSSILSKSWTISLLVKPFVVPSLSTIISNGSSNTGYQILSGLYTTPNLALAGNEILFKNSDNLYLDSDPAIEEVLSQNTWVYLNVVFNSTVYNETTKKGSGILNFYVNGRKLQNLPTTEILDPQDVFLIASSFKGAISVLQYNVGAIEESKIIDNFNTFRLLYSDVDFDIAFKQFSKLVTDSTGTNFEVTHNFGTKDYISYAYLNNSNYENVITDLKHKTNNTFEIALAKPLGSEQLKTLIFRPTATNIYKEIVDVTSNTEFVLTHNFKSKDVIVYAYQNFGDYEKTFVGVEKLTENSVKIIFAETANETYNIIVFNPPKKAKKFLVGNGAGTTFTITHDFGTKDVLVSIFDTIYPYNEIYTTIKHTTLNQVVLEFATPPFANQYQVTIFGNKIQTNL